MSVAIKVESLGKKYIIQHEKKSAHYETLSDSLIQGSKNIINRISHPFSRSKIEQQTREEFWALKDINFEIEQGEKVGIIGRNGAGKSTLLKILSRITEPTCGKIHINGRIASLLEVGTGFHGELTGAENIYLNGAILGMKHKEIKDKFDEIVDFADVEKFLDTPVKRYSSGMYMRLAFSVAAHLEPEILIVDEVLAVGDVQFQKKCLGKMQNVSRDGRTVLFVSHNIEAIMTLCPRGIVLNKGLIEYDGSAGDAISLYNDRNREQELIQNFSNRGGSGGAKINEIQVCDENLNTVSQLPVNHSAILSLKATLEPAYQSQKIVDVGFGIDSLEGERLITLVASWNNAKILTNGEVLAVTCQVPYFPLIPGTYLVTASISFLNDTLDCVIHCIQFRIVNNQQDTLCNRQKEHGKVTIPCNFQYKVFETEHV